MTAIWFSLSVHSIVTAQNRLECFGAFIVYLSTISNVSITFSCIQFVSLKSCIYTCINIFAETRCTTLLEKYLTLFCFLQKPGGFQWSALAWNDLEPSCAYVNLFLPINSISWWQHLMLSSEFHCKENDGMTGAVHWIQTFFGKKTRLLWCARLLTLLISGDIHLGPAQKIAQGYAYKSKLEHQQLIICHCLSNGEAYLQNLSFNSLTKKSILTIMSVYQLLEFPQISIHLKYGL